MSTGSIFLLPNGTWFVELAVVLVILWVVTKYALPMLNTAIEARQDKIRTALTAADEARAAAEAAGDERTRVLDEARDQAREIVANAQALSDQVKAESGARGEAEYERIVAQANAEVAAARQRAIDEASARIGEIVFDLVAKVVGREVDQSAHQDLVREAVAALNAEAQKEANR
ncbi:MAG: F0F1 ATP synthase subunit B [Acidobacteriota bacterium]|nr:F0F1 ATP synthase subunit B [Acidobacteriota bacterium]MDE3030642.1 F0F1 ATP synthase subunit B [Acidobacteriota bacterium]MDE3092776.1 F0F1 ATP synthase subunit B [Acidobacteriota bacterium]MDE3139021.1 F0F1 ATP synthase subunit B [Acidobacteriota bacterium]MDE3145872.1 F0F1 ATP synthase subunit B [Acidobacteriota bacterium]